MGCIVDKVSLNSLVVCDAECVFEEGTSILRKPDMWDSCVYEGQDTLVKKRLGFRLGIAKRD